MSETPFNIVYLTVSISAYLIFGIRAARLRSRISPPALISTASLFLGATAFLLGAPAVYRWIGEVSGMNNLATLLVYSSVLLYGGTAQTMALMWSPPSASPAGSPAPPAGRQFLIAGGLVATLALLFAWADPQGEPTPLTFDVEHADQPALLIFLIVYQVGWLYACLFVFRICRARLFQVSAEQPVLRRGLHWVMTGLLTCSTYGICKLVAITTVAVGSHRLDVLSNVIGPMASAAGACLIVYGFFYPVVTQWLADRRDYRRLAPLWEATVPRHVPHRALASSSPLSGRLAVSSASFLLARRIIEITDAQRSLQPFIPQEPAQAVRAQAAQHQLTGERLRAAEEAAGLLAALKHPADTPRPPQTRPVTERRLASDTDAQRERAHLLQVADSLRHPAVLTAIQPQR
ncbi:MAB_1171c family putative transporter [Streptomyces sp. NPDC002835]